MTVSTAKPNTNGVHTTRTKSIEAPPCSVWEPGQSPTTDQLVNELVTLGIDDAPKYKAQLSKLLLDNGQSFRVKDLYPRFARETPGHNFLRLLRTKEIIRPIGGEHWKADTRIMLARVGRALAQSYQKRIKSLVFISYSHKDELWRDRLVEHLQVLEHQCELDLWYDRKIDFGSQWRDEIKDALERSHAAILLISSSFMSSEFIKDNEVPYLLERAKKDDGLRLFPILVRPCAWQAVTWLKDMQIRPLDGEALSGGTDHDVDMNLTKMILEIAELLSLPCG